MSAMSLGEDLGIETSHELKERLAGYLEQAALVLDGGQVRRVHTAGVQVLCAFFRSRRQAGHHTELAACSEVLRDAVRLLGVDAQLGLAAGGPALETTNNMENPA